MSYSLDFSPSFGIVRKSRIENLSNQKVIIDVLDGLMNIMPANTNKKLQAESSCLLDAYKRAELLDFANFAIFYYNSLPSDRAEALECLKATIVWSFGLKPKNILLSTRQLAKFAKGERLDNERESRGLKGAYLINARITVSPHQSKEWLIVADTEKDIIDIKKFEKLAENKNILKKLLSDDIRTGRDELEKIIYSADGFQFTADEKSSLHHLSNVLFNSMRGGLFANNGMIDTADFADYVRNHNLFLVSEAEKMLKDFKSKIISISEFRNIVLNSDNVDLRRIGLEYLPLIFSRRHGDPSRPWNRFEINLRTRDGKTRLFYQGNWRDLFQNWEALCYSYPEFTESVIAKFLNCSSAEGYNPYRISRDGFEWECPDPEDPWANIGYWGDHQLIYLLRLLELQEKLNPERLYSLLSEKIFAYANIPYKIKNYKDLIEDPRNTIVFDEQLNSRLLKEFGRIGNDAKLLKDKNGKTIHVTMMEKLLVTILAKIANFVPDGGIWMNTQRPEWNDANNALAGYGLSVVTTCYLHRFLLFMKKILRDSQSNHFFISSEIILLLRKFSSILDKNSKIINKITPSSRRMIMDLLGNSVSEFRNLLYGDGFSAEFVKIYSNEIVLFIETALKWIKNCILKNEREDGLFNSYNILDLKGADEAKIDFLSEMLEGQVAVLSSGVLSPEKALGLLVSMKKSRLYRKDQNSYMLQPEVNLKSFIEKNNVPDSAIEKSSFIRELLKYPDNPLFCIDVSGKVHFSSDIKKRGRS